MKALIPLCIVCITVSCSSGGSSDNAKANNVVVDTVPKQAASSLWLGNWERHISKNEASLEITNVRADSIRFTLSAFSGGHNGEIEGVAGVYEVIFK